jgi:hypothetical protein
MIITIQTLLNDAFGMLGIYDGTNPLTPWEYQTGLTAFNNLVDSWNNLNLMVYSVSAYTLPFVAGTQVYQVGATNQFLASISGTALTLAASQALTLGSTILDANTQIHPGTTVKSGSGTSYILSQNCGTIAQELMGLCLAGGSPSVPTFNWNIARPTRIERMSVLYNPGSGMPVELPIAPPWTELEQWQGIPVKWTQSAYPTCCYNDEAFPYMNLNVWPIPSGPSQAVLYAWDQLGEATGLTNNIELPPGYNDALTKCMAMDLSLRFPGCIISPELRGQAAAARKAINNINEGIPTLKLDPMFSGRGSSVELQSHGRVSF